MNAIEKRWTDYATKNLVGKKVTSVRYLSDEEMNALDWSQKSLVIQFDDGSVIYPSQDDEGNGPGALFGQNKIPRKTGNSTMSLPAWKNKTGKLFGPIPSP